MVLIITHLLIMWKMMMLLRLDPLSPITVIFCTGIKSVKIELLRHKNQLLIDKTVTKIFILKK